MLTRFKALRTLSLSYMGIHSIPDSIGELIHLRYLDLSANSLKHLPNSIYKLHHLMTLVLQDCQFLETLPQEIDRLVSLRHLYIDGCCALESMPERLIALTSLVNLDWLIVGRRSGGLRYLNELNNLSGGVSIELPQEGWMDAVEDAKRSNMSNKHRLTRMDISWGGDLLPAASCARKMPKDEAAKVLEALEPPEMLEYLKISNYGGEKLSSWFCKLRNLTELSLYRCDHVEYLQVDMKGGDVFFPCLEKLTLAEMKNLKGWWRQEIPRESTERPSLDEVSYVCIRDCPELKENMPVFEGVEDLYLRRVDVKLLEMCLPPADSINDLEQVELEEIKGFTCLQEGWISHLTSLWKLDIKDCGDLRQVSRRGLANLTALEELSLGRSCKIVDEDVGMDDQIEVGTPWKMLHELTTLTIPHGDKHFREGLGHLRFLTELEIGKCKGEKNVNFVSKVSQGLHILRIGFHKDKRVDLSKTGIQCLPQLTELWVGVCKELYVDWKSLLINTKLQKLVLYCVENVIHVGDMVVEQQSTLQHLRIEHTREAKWIHDIPWKSLTSLLTLSLNNIEEMEELPEGIQHLSSMECLFVTGCEKIRSFPDWITIGNFPPPLMLLEIEDCPLLEQGSPEICSMLQRFNAQETHDSLSRSIDNVDDRSYIVKVIMERREEIKKKRNCT